MNTPANLKYAKTHEWVRAESDGTLTVGISDHAQELLGDVVFVGLPTVGTAYAAGDPVTVLESVKAAADAYAPVSGSITDINQTAADAPESLNKDPYGTWLFKIKPNNTGDAASLMDAKAYEAHVASES